MSWHKPSAHHEDRHPRPGEDVWILHALGGGSLNSVRRECWTRGKQRGGQDEYLTFVAEAYGHDGRDVGRLVEPYQAFYHDEPLGRTTRYLRELSTGNRKKIGLMAAMFIEPDVLVLDEPFANLDPRAQIQLKQMLSDLHAVHGTTVLISSHDLGHVTEVCDRILLLNDGRIIRDTSRSERTYDELRQFFGTTVPPTAHVSGK